MTTVKTTYPGSTDGLRALRDEVDAMTDEQVEKMLHREWMAYDGDGSGCDESTFDRMKSRIDSNTNRSRNKKRPLIRWAQIAAAVLLPLFMISTVVLYQREARALSSEEMMTFSTGNGERASVVLPDGTKVTLNVNSELSYRIKNYNRKERNVRFSGEGYFEVAHNEKIPYIINTPGLEVTVLGTTFNFFNRESEGQAELALEEGSVRLLSTLNGNTAVLKPDQKVTLCQETGRFYVADDRQIENISAWTQGDLIFRNTKLAYVLKTIENNYSIKFDMSELIDQEELFSGTLPAGNLNEVLDILERSFHMKTSIYDNTVHFSSL